MNIKANVNSIYKDIKEYSIYPEKVTLVAVTKYVDIDIIKKLLDLGVTTFGENKVQILREKHQLLIDEKQHKWHFIGNLQRNKVKYIAPFVDLIHSVNKLSLAMEIDKQALKHSRKIDVLIEINIFKEDSKGGYIYEKLLEEIPQLLSLENINIIGVMGMAPDTSDVEYIRDGFRKLREIKEELNLNYFKGKLTELSMGMSGDYKIALQEGATFIRIGTNLYK